MISTTREVEAKLQWAINVFLDITIDEETRTFRHPRRVVALAYAVRKTVDQFIEVNMVPEMEAREATRH